MLEQRIEQDLKKALLAGDSQRVSTLRVIKSAFLNYKVAHSSRDQLLEDDVAISLLSKEAKQRAEAAQLYTQGGDQKRSEAELQEKAIIEEYLPTQLSEVELTEVIREIVKTTESEGPAAMGKVIGDTKKRTQGAADGAMIARIVKSELGL